jgi:hypothetical protein
MYHLPELTLFFCPKKGPQLKWCKMFVHPIDFLIGNRKISVNVALCWPVDKVVAGMIDGKCLWMDGLWQNFKKEVDNKV